MFSLIIGIIAILVGIVMFAFAKSSAKLVGLFPILLGVILIAISSFTVIQAKNVGVLTTFGKPTKSLEAGLHFKAPWQKVTELDGTKITNRYEGDQAIDVRIGDGTTAGVETAIRWSIVGDRADEIYADYRSDDVNETVRESLIETVFKNAINSVMGEYNPTADLVAVDPEKAGRINFTPDLDALSQSVTESMRKRVSEAGGYVNIEFVTISHLRLSGETQKKINEFQQEIARTQVAMQAEKTNKAQARANKALAESISNDPNILVSRCVDVLQMMVETQQSIPTGFSCWPGTNDNLILPGR